jgi:hypothetical protein
VQADNGKNVHVGSWNIQEALMPTVKERRRSA